MPRQKVLRRVHVPRPPGPSYPTDPAVHLLVCGRLSRASIPQWLVFLEQQRLNVKLPSIAQNEL